MPHISKGLTPLLCLGSSTSRNGARARVLRLHATLVEIVTNLVPTQHFRYPMVSLAPVRAKAKAGGRPKEYFVGWGQREAFGGRNPGRGPAHQMTSFPVLDSQLLGFVRAAFQAFSRVSQNGGPPNFFGQTSN